MELGTLGFWLRLHHGQSVVDLGTKVVKSSKITEPVVLGVLWNQRL